MSNVTRVAIDLAKQVFHVSAMNDADEVVERKRLRRAGLRRTWRCCPRAARWRWRRARARTTGAVWQRATAIAPDRLPGMARSASWKEDDHVTMALRLQAEFGLRREEAIKFTPVRDDRGDRIRLKGSTTKGGRPREVPVLGDLPLTGSSAVHPQGTHPIPPVHCVRAVVHAPAEDLDAGQEARTPVHLDILKRRNPWMPRTHSGITPRSSFSWEITYIL